MEPDPPPFDFELNAPWWARGFVAYAIQIAVGVAVPWVLYQLGVWHWAYDTTVWLYRALLSLVV